MDMAAYGHDVPGPSARGARIGRPIAASILRAGWKIRVHGHDLIPRHGPVILASNHTGILDGPLLYSVVKRSVHALGKEEMFTGLVGRALHAIGQIPVDRSRCDVAAIKNCLAVLRRGDVLGIYPEGTRGDGRFERTKPGAAYLALCTGAPIVPVVGLGVRPLPPSAKSLPKVRATIDIVFGQPIDTTPIGWPRRRDVVRERAEFLTERLREHLRDACARTGRDLPQARMLSGEY